MKKINNLNEKKKYDKYFNYMNVIYKVFTFIILIILIHKLRKTLEAIDKNNKAEQIEKEKEKSQKIIKNPYYSLDLSGKILFMRHGQTFFNEDKDYKSRRIKEKYIDCKLSREGIKQAKSKQRVLNKLKIEKVYVSPLYRALQTLTYSLEKHPDRKNIVAFVHPLVSESANCVNDYILNIKQTKKDFNMKSKIKINWTLFYKYVKGIKYNENFFYFDNLDNMDIGEKSKMYKKLKTYYDNGEIKKYKKGLVELAKMTLDSKKYFESLKKSHERFINFMRYIKKKYSKTLANKNKKILVFSHGSFMTGGTNFTPYKNKNLQKFHPKCHTPKNCEIISYNILNIK